MINDRDKEVKDFIKKLHSGDYKIDPEANKIPYGNGKTLAQALSDALENYQSMESLNLPSFSSAYAYSLITSCFAHGVLKTKSDMIDQIRSTERLLDDCASKNSRLEQDNKELRKQLTGLNQEYKKLKDKK